MTTKTLHFPSILGVALLVGWLAGCASEPTAPPQPQPNAPSSAPKGKLSEKARQEQRQAILKVYNRTLNQLYTLKPLTRTEIAQAAGHGVFEINGLNAVLAGNHGRGVVFDKSGKATYMQLARTDIGPGATVTPYWQVLVFRDPAQLSSFVAAPTPADVSKDPSITVYQLNARGVSTQTDWGARYFQNPDLD